MAVVSQVRDGLDTAPCDIEVRDGERAQDAKRIETLWRAVDVPAIAGHWQGGHIGCGIARVKWIGTIE